MFEKGEYVVYGTTGVCEIADITTLNMKGVTKNRLYYVLSPCHQKDSKIFTPVDNDKTIIRAILTREEASSLIKDIPEIEEFSTNDDKQREEKYKETIRNCESRDLVKVIKTLYIRRQERVAQGKKTTAMDEKYLKIAEDNLYSELSIALNIPKEQMGKYILEKMAELDS